MTRSLRGALTPAVRTGLWVGLATGLYGISFGALSIAVGLDVLQTCALSLLMFTGGSQFAFIGVIGGGGAGLAAWSAASLLGIRNGVYGMQLKALLQPPTALTPVMAQFTIDESMAVSSAQHRPDEQRRGFWAGGVGVFIFWNIATLVGALAGNQIGDLKTWGLDGAAVAAFCGLLWPHLKARNPIIISLAAAVVTIAAIPHVAPGLPILIAGAVSVLIWWFRQRNSSAQPPQQVAS